MFKSIFHVFLVFIICITASGIPVDRSTFDFSQNFFTHKDNTSHSINSEKSSLQDPIPKRQILYTSLPTYIPTVNETARGMMGLTLFFPDKTNPQDLIPVTRFVKNTRTPLRTVIHHLHEGALGLTSPVPNISKLQVQNNMVIVHLPVTLNQYNENALSGKVILQSLVYSLTSVSGIDQVKFLVDGKESDNLFGDYSTKTIFTPNDQPRAYLGLNHNNKRVLLVPKKIDSVPTAHTIENMIHSLQTTKISNTSLNHLIATIPSNVALIDFSHKGSLLELNFNQAFLQAYVDRADLQAMMIDSILLSFTSMKDIESVQILVDNQPVQSLGNIDLSVPLNKPKFTNPESS
ncbi:GerMN domain-containing protein [Clostridiaceae bacterium 35-E11]